MGGVKDGGAVRIGVVLLGLVVLIGGVGLSFEPITLESTGWEGADLWNLENLFASQAIWYACSKVLTSLMKDKWRFIRPLKIGKRNMRPNMLKWIHLLE